VQLVQRVAKVGQLLALDGIETGEDERLGRLVARQRPWRGPDGRGHRVAHLCVAHALEARGDVTDLARPELLDRDQLRPEDTQLKNLALGAAGHEPHRVALREPSGE
jgi:hypothetical protein